MAAAGGLTLLAAGGGVAGLDCGTRSTPASLSPSRPPLRTGNGVSYPSRLTLPAGAEVRERHRRGGWVQVELPGGGVGWVPASALLAGSRYNPP